MNREALFAMIAIVTRAYAATEGGTCGTCVCRTPEDCYTAAQPDLLARSCCERDELVCCPESGVSARKCREYATLVYLNMAPDDEEMDEHEKVSACAVPQNEQEQADGGSRVAPGELPHLALLGYGDVGEEADWRCAGALIAARWVLTAAQCLHLVDTDGDSSDDDVPVVEPRPVRWVRLGALSRGRGLGTNEGAQQLSVSGSVSGRVAHPRYRPPARDNDIGLLFLARRPALGAAVRPACLTTTFTIPALRAFGSGYGRHSVDPDMSRLVVSDLRRVSLPLVRRVDCIKHYRGVDGEGEGLEDDSTITLPRGLSRAMLCAGDAISVQDTCQCDYGSPLQITMSDPYCMYALVGVTAYGKACPSDGGDDGSSPAPIVFSRVSHFVPWIESVVWPEEFPAVPSSFPSRPGNEAFPEDEEEKEVFDV